MKFISLVASLMVFCGVIYADTDTKTLGDEQKKVEQNIESFGSKVHELKNTEDDAKSLIEDLGRTAIDTLTDKNIPETEREKRFQGIFERVFAVKPIAKFVLGRYRRGATVDEKEDFLSLFLRSISRTYAARFRNYNNEEFQVLSAQKVGDGFKVKSKIVRPTGPPVDVEWKVYALEDGTLKIFDVIVEHVSMSMTQRSEYGSIIQQNGGRLADLNRALHKSLQDRS